MSGWTDFEENATGQEVAQRRFRGDARLHSVQRTACIQKQNIMIALLSAAPPQPLLKELLSRLCSCFEQFHFCFHAKPGDFSTCFALYWMVPSLSLSARISSASHTNTPTYPHSYTQATPTARADQSKISSNCCCQKMSNICQLSLLIIQPEICSFREARCEREKMRSPRCAILTPTRSELNDGFNWDKSWCWLIDWLMADGRHIWLTMTENVTHFRDMTKPLNELRKSRCRYFGTPFTKYKWVHSVSEKSPFVYAPPLMRLLMYYHYIPRHHITQLTHSLKCSAQVHNNPWRWLCVGDLTAQARSSIL